MVIAVFRPSGYNRGNMPNDEHQPGTPPATPHVDSPESAWDELMRPLFNPSRATGIYSVPRRFDLATIFVVTAAYSILLGGLTALDATPIIKTLVAGFVTIVAISQAGLEKRIHPRGTSIIAGAIAFTIIVAVEWLELRRHVPIPFIAIVIAGVLIGSFLGYLAGTVAGGVFLVADLLRGRLERRPSPTKADEDNGEDTDTPK